MILLVNCMVELKSTFYDEFDASSTCRRSTPSRWATKLLAKLARDATFFVRAHESNEMQPTLAIAMPGSAWSWLRPTAPGKALERMGQRQGVVPARPAGRGLQHSPSSAATSTIPGKARSTGCSPATRRSMTGHQAHGHQSSPAFPRGQQHSPRRPRTGPATCRWRPSLVIANARGWEQLEQCGYPVQRLVALYGGATVDGDEVDQVILQRPGQPRQRRRPGRSDPRAAGAGPSGPDPGRRRERALSPAGHSNGEAGAASAMTW